MAAPKVETHTRLKVLHTAEASMGGSLSLHPDRGGIAGSVRIVEIESQYIMINFFYLLRELFQIYPGSQDRPSNSAGGRELGVKSRVLTLGTGGFPC